MDPFSRFMAGVSGVPGSCHVPEDFIFIRRSICELIGAIRERRESISDWASELAEDPFLFRWSSLKSGPFNAKKKFEIWVFPCGYTW